MLPKLDEVQKSLLEAGIKEFNSARFWHAHEDWEELWKSLKSESIEDGYVDAVQGLIQIAALLFQYQKCNQRGVENMWNKSTAKLGLPDTPSFASLWGMDVQRLLIEVSDYVGAAKIEDWAKMTDQVKINMVGE